MPSVKNHYELIYVTRTGINKKIYNAFKERLTPTQIQGIKDSIIVNYDYGKIFITIMRKPIHEEYMDEILDLIEEEAIPDMMEDEFCTSETYKMIERTNEYQQYIVELPVYIQNYLVTGVW